MSSIYSSPWVREAGAYRCGSQKLKTERCSRSVKKQILRATPATAPLLPTHDYHDHPSNLPPSDPAMSTPTLRAANVPVTSPACGRNHPSPGSRHRLPPIRARLERCQPLSFLSHHILPHTMSTPSTPSTQTAPTERSILAVACLSLLITIVTATAGFVAYRSTSLITRHIELMFTRDTILPLLMPEITPPHQQTSEPPNTSSTAQPKLPLGQLGKGKERDEEPSDDSEAEQMDRIARLITKYRLLFLYNRLILTDRGGAFLALRSPSQAARFPSYSRRPTRP